MEKKRGNNSLGKTSNSQLSMETLLQIAEHVPLKVLHVDDDSNQLMFTKIFLEECDPDIKVLSISRPLDAIQILSVEEFDCIVSDYQMDEMDGIALTRKVREESDVPIIIYTGKGSEEVEEIARRAGADGYVQKENDPIHYMGLYSQIRTITHERNHDIIRK
jgi:CheY-like chemotaxis protein